MAAHFQGSCSSTLFCKDIDNMLPFNPYSVWNFACNDPIRKRAANPIVTGSSVLGIVYNDGVMIAADTLGSYFNTSRYLNCQRVMRVNDQTLLGAGGDIADFQHLQSVITQSVIDDECLNDGFSMKPKSLYSWLTRTMYNRRSQGDPLWNVLVIGGMQDGAPFLGYVDKLGTAFEAKSIASGFGLHLAQPLLRGTLEKNPNISRHDAQRLIHECMKTLYKRDTKTIARYTLGVVDKDGVQVSDPIPITVDWSIAYYERSEY